MLGHIGFKTTYNDPLPAQAEEPKKVADQVQAGWVWRDHCLIDHS